VIGRLTGAFANRDDYFVSYWLDNGPVLLLARAAAVLATVGVVWIGMRLAKRMAGGGAAFLVGGVLALSPLLVTYGQLVTPDVWVALFSALAIARIVAIQQRGATADYVWAGIWIGLGISSKYTPLLLLPGVFAAHVLRAPAPGAPGLAARKVQSFVASQPWLGVLVAAAAFAVTSPFVLLNPAGADPRRPAPDDLHDPGALGDRRVRRRSSLVVRAAPAPRLG
jgi:4-amino-4-deoxy-L-arabinose transferase-like glycosyltransferase